MKKIPEIEGLRAYFAWWVVIYHIQRITAFEKTDSGIRGIGDFFFNPITPVMCFVIISGFVIFYLLDNKEESYPVYITRRFFRLYPLFIVTMLIGIFAWDMRVEAKEMLSPLFPDGLFEQRISKNFGTYEPYFWQNFFSHLFMLHGVVPDSTVPHGVYAFVGPAWSISLEWQFYLLAPFLYMLSTRIKSGLRIVFVSSLLLSIFMVFIAPTAIAPVKFTAGFYPVCAIYFAFGIWGYFAFKKAEAIHSETGFFTFKYGKYIFYVFSFLLLAGYFAGVVDLHSIWAPIILCGLALICIMETKFGKPNKLHKLVVSAFNNKVSIYLGKVSYSTYLVHAFVLDGFIYFFAQYLPLHSPQISMWIMFACVVPLSLVTSILAYHYIEEPGIRLSARLAKRWNAKSTLLEPAPEQKSS